MCNNNGWICPKCGCVLAPWISECPHHLPNIGVGSPIPWPYNIPSTGDPLPNGHYTVCTTDNEVGVK